MPKLDCEGNGHDFLCGNEPQFNDIKITDANNNTITTAHPGDTVYIKAMIHGYNWPCSNFTLFFYGRQAEYLGCYEDRVGNGENWWVPWPYIVPEYPGTTITCGALEVLTGIMLTTPLTILGYPCDYWINQADCEAEGCYWWNGFCHAELPGCEQINNQADCEDYGCWWYQGSCHSSAPPTCTEGEEKCIGYDLWRCINGEWVLIEQNSEQCGYVPPPECEQIDNQASCEAAGCWWYQGSCHSSAPPTCTESDTKCVGYDLYTCINGQWVLTEQNSSDCGYTPPSDECAQHTTQAACEAAGCYWYPYPNPFGEPLCHDKEMLQAYLPFIIAGVGGAILLAAVLIPSRKPAPTPAYYPPYPPPLRR